MHNHSSYISGLLFLLLTLPVAVYSQGNYFQRLFPATDRQTFNLGAEPTGDGGFYMGNVYADNTTSDLGVNVTKHDPKGNIIWSFDYDVGNLDFVVDFRRIDFQNIGGDTLVISGVVYGSQALTEADYILKIEPRNGDLIYSGLIGNRDEVAGPSVWPRVYNGFNNDLFYAGTRTDSDSTLYMHVQKFNRNFEPDTGRSFVALDNDGFERFTAFTEGTMTMDSNIVLACMAENFGMLNEVGLLSLDTSLNILRGQGYSIDTMAYDAMQVFGVESLPDSSLVVMGSYVELTSMLFNGFLFKIDTTGSIEWARNIAAPGQFSFAVPNALLYTDNDEILVSGKSVNLASGEVMDYSVFLDTEGNVIRQQQYQSVNSFFADLQTGLFLLSGDLYNLPDQSLLYTTGGIDLNMGVLYSPLAIKMDYEGHAMCEDTLDAEFISDLTMMVDTLRFRSDNVVDFDTLSVSKDIFDNHDVPVLTLLDTLFCPQDPIDVTLDATLENADSYEWSTGDTTATLRVMEQGQYTVTVTLSDRVCYMLCDTSIISVAEEPMVSITPSVECAGEVTLRAQSNNQIVSVNWSTGDSTASIIVNESGNYSVTITDACGLTATASLTIGEGLFNLEPIIERDDSDICEFMELTLSVSTQFGGQLSYLWSTGETTQSIVIDNPGDYTVTISDICGNMESTTISISEGFFDFEAEISVQQFRLCHFRELVLQDESPLATMWMWSTGETTQQIIVSEPGTYTVTVTNICDEVAVGSVVIEDENFDLSFTTEIVTNVIDEASCIVSLSTINNTMFPVNYIWSTGDTTESIFVGQEGNYSVTVTNDCGEMAEDDITLEFGPIGTEIVSDQIDEESCIMSLSTINTTAATDSLMFLVNYVWSTGETSDSILIEEGGTYSVTVTNVCGESATDSFTTSDTLLFPNIFFPIGVHEENQIFRPVILCPEFFNGEDYIFEVYNRWGNKVFETNQVQNGWNGRHNGDAAPTGVYMFFARWTNTAGEEQTVQNDVTLHR